MCHLYIKFFKNNTMYIFVYKYIFILFLSGTQGYVTTSWERLFLLLSCSVMSDSLQPHGLQHDGPPCPSPSPGAYSNSCPLCWWGHPTISSSVIPFSSHLQSFPASGSFPVSQFFASCSQSIGVSASASVLPMISFRINWLDLLAIQGTLKRPAPQFKSISSSALSFLYSPTLTFIHDYWKNHMFD